MDQQVSPSTYGILLLSSFRAYPKLFSPQSKVVNQGRHFWFSLNLSPNITGKWICQIDALNPLQIKNHNKNSIYYICICLIWKLNMKKIIFSIWRLEIRRAWGAMSVPTDAISSRQHWLKWQLQRLIRLLEYSSWLHFLTQTRRKILNIPQETSMHETCPPTQHDSGWYAYKTFHVR